jgi:hypothetical protein
MTLKTADSHLDLEDFVECILYVLPGFVAY